MRNAKYWYVGCFVTDWDYQGIVRCPEAIPLEKALVRERAAEVITGAYEGPASDYDRLVVVAHFSPAILQSWGMVKDHPALFYWRVVNHPQDTRFLNVFSERIDRLARDFIGLTEEPSYILQGFPEKNCGFPVWYA